jgi:7-cyano-7-deazaguanine synthase
MKEEKALVLLSGGLDSAVAAAAGAMSYNLQKGLFFDYGQLAAARELKAAGDIASFLGIEIETVALPFLGDLSGSAITGGSDSSGIDAGSGAGSVWVENRNGIFLNIGAAVAVASGCRVLLAGFNREEAEEFPDNSVEYIEAVNRALAIGELKEVRVESPTGGMNKKEIAAEGISRGIPFESLWSCYRGEERMCGRCDSCLRLRRAVKDTEAEGSIKFEGESFE